MGHGEKGLTVGEGRGSGPSRQEGRSEARQVGQEPFGGVPG